MTLQQSQNRY